MVRTEGNRPERLTNPFAFLSRCLEPTRQRYSTLAESALDWRECVFFGWRRRCGARRDRGSGRVARPRPVSPPFRSPVRSRPLTSLSTRRWRPVPHRFCRESRVWQHHRRADGVCQWIASQGFVTSSAGYGLAQQHPFPVGFDGGPPSGTRSARASRSRTRRDPRGPSASTASIPLSWR